MLVDFEINRRIKILWASWLNQYAWGGEVVGYYNKNTGKILSKRQYKEMIERELQEKWLNMDLNEMANFESFDDFKKSTLNDVDTDYEPLIEVIISDDEKGFDMYEPFIEMHWLEILALEHEKSIYQIAKKGGLPTSTLYSIIDRDTPLGDITIETISKILKGLEITIFGFIYKYDGRLF